MITSDDIRGVFEEIHRRAFVLDESVNRRLAVDVIGAGDARGAQVFVLITPWALNGLVFSPDGRLPARLTISGREYRTWPIDVAGLGPHHSISLAPNVRQMPSLEAARKTAHALAEPLRSAVARARESVGVADPARRTLLRRPIDAALGRSRG